MIDDNTRLRDAIEEALNKEKEFPNGYFLICNTVAQFYHDYPLYFDSILGEIKITEDESNDTLFQIYVVGEQINDLIGGYITTCISNGDMYMDSALLPQTIFALWGGICGIISLAHKKEKYILHRMQQSKEDFMQNGFKLLLRSILPKEKN